MGAVDGMALKLNGSGSLGFPDRILLFPNGSVIFVEVKQLKKKPRRAQLIMHARLRAMNQVVKVLDRIDDIPKLIELGKSIKVIR
jgi:predicted mannosyl-3-phosphoglycerate phosphatase (HAD superfamily)